MPVIPAMWGSTNRIVVQVCRGIKQNFIFKITYTKRAGGMVPTVDGLPSEQYPRKRKKKFKISSESILV
jgi:hypothetical protein